MRKHHDAEGVRVAIDAASTATTHTVSGLVHAPENNAGKWTHLPYPDRVRDFADLVPLLVCPEKALPALPGAYVADCLTFVKDRAEDARRLMEGASPSHSKKGPHFARTLPGDCWAMPLIRSLLRLETDVRSRVKSAFQLNEEESSHV